MLRLALALILLTGFLTTVIYLEDNLALVFGLAVFAVCLEAAIEDVVADVREHRAGMHRHRRHS